MNLKVLAHFRFCLRVCQFLSVYLEKYPLAMTLFQRPTLSCQVFLNYGYHFFQSSKKQRESIMARGSTTAECYNERHLTNFRSPTCTKKRLSYMRTHVLSPISSNKKVCVELKRCIQIKQTYSIAQNVKMSLRGQINVIQKSAHSQ